MGDFPTSDTGNVILLRDASAAKRAQNEAALGVSPTARAEARADRILAANRRYRLAVERHRRRSRPATSAG